MRDEIRKLGIIAGIAALAFVFREPLIRIGRTILDEVSSWWDSVGPIENRGMRVEELNQTLGVRDRRARDKPE